MDEQSLQRVKELREKGLTIKQVATEMRVGRSSVERAVAKLKQLEKDKPAADQEERTRQLVREELERDKDSGGKQGDGLPVVRKMGQGVEVITPEAVLRHYMDGDEEELRGMMKLRAAMLMVMDLVNIRKTEAEVYALMVKPILDMMKETREEQDAAAQRAKASSLEVAQQAAQGVAGQVMNALEPRLAALEQKKPDIATVPNPFAGMMARAMEPMLMQLMGQVGKTLGGMSLPGTATQPGQPAGQGVGFQQMTDEERKSVFGG